jgi:predicted 5'-methylthioadenosine/S-adenosylhomocysteine nucleosidase
VHVSILAYRCSVTLLVVAALAEEVARLPGGVEVLVTGVGKARATAALGRRLAEAPRPDLVVNVGTAGSVDGAITGLVEVTWVTQHDLPYDAIEALVGAPVDRGFALATDAVPMPLSVPPAGATMLATADIFVADGAHARRLAAQGIHLVDMEAFGFAAACAEFAVPFRCVKVVSDFADEAASDSWIDTVDACARSLGEFVGGLLPAE